MYLLITTYFVKFWNQTQSPLFLIHIGFHEACVCITENVKKPASQNESPSKEMQPDVSWATQPSSLHYVWQLSTITVFLETFMYLRVSPWVHLVLQESLAHRLGIVAILYSKVTKIKFSEKCYFHHTLFFLMLKAFFSRCFCYNCCPVSLFLLCLIKDNFVHWLGEADTNYGRKQ